MFYYNGKITCFQLWNYGQRQVSTRLVTTFAICPEYFPGLFTFTSTPPKSQKVHFVLLADSSQDLNLDNLLAYADMRSPL